VLKEDDKTLEAVMRASHTKAKRRTATRATVSTTPMTDISFALLDAYQKGAPIEHIARQINLPAEWVEERIEAARLCLKLPRSYISAAF